VKEDEMDMICGVHGGIEDFVGKAIRKETTRKTGIGWRIIVKWISMK
jgi:hypothetical protein